MSFKYDLTAVEILKLLGYMEPVGKRRSFAGRTRKKFETAFLFDWKTPFSALCSY